MSIYISETGINCLIFIIWPVDKGISGSLCLRYLYLLVFAHRLLLFCVLVYWCSIIRLISFLTVSIWAVCLKQPHALTPARAHAHTNTQVCACLRIRAWYEVAQNVALIQPSSAFIERMFSILRAWMDARQGKSYSDRIAAATLPKCNRASERRN